MTEKPPPGGSAKKNLVAPALAKFERILAEFEAVAKGCILSLSVSNERTKFLSGSARLPSTSN
jgi:hypothetical protein